MNPDFSQFPIKHLFFWPKYFITNWPGILLVDESFEKISPKCRVILSDRGLHRCWWRMLVTTLRYWWRLWPFRSPTSTIYHNSCTHIQKRLPNSKHQHYNVTNITVRLWSFELWAIWTIFFDWPFDHKLSKMNSIRMNCIYVYIHFFECNLKRKINFGHI